MVKANAYGHGMLRIVEYGLEELQLKSFGVASLGEALRLRKYKADYRCELYVFSDLAIQDRWEDYLNFKLIPVITQMDDFYFLLDHPQCRRLPLVLHFDTGMNRLGLPLPECETVIYELQKRRRSVYHLMTHFSDSYLPEREKNQATISKISRTQEGLSRRWY